MLSAALLAAAAFTVRPAAAQQSQRYTLSGSDVAVWNLVGSITLGPGTGSSVVVTVARAGTDAGQLQVRHGALDGHDALRVVFPARDIHYDARDYTGQGRITLNTTVRVNDDGTFGENGGRRIRISTRGGDIEARADCQVLVPEGKAVTVHLAAGIVNAANVNGQITTDVLLADVHGQQMRGPMRVRSTSGDVTLDGLRGPVDVQTASGDVTLGGAQDVVMIQTSSGDIGLRDAHATRATVQSASGDVRAAGLALGELAVSTSSGDVHLDSSRVNDLTVNSSSGDIDVALAPDVKAARLSASSGDVTVRVPQGTGLAFDATTGSGDVNVDSSRLGMQVLTHRDHRFVGRIGNGSARVETSTASGDVRIVPVRSGS
ncbi:MAG TPA: DUF4097 family beta strand repeat-containing protein [Gemmatimonadaceae bacterium]